MSSANVLPSAPEYEAASTQSIYPQLPNQPNSFRLSKINEISTALNNEVAHYWLVAKKYKRAKTFVHYTAVGAGAVSGILSASSVGALFTVVGAAASIPLAGVSVVFGAGASSKGVARGGSWGARDPPFCKPYLSKQPTTGGENAMTMWCHSVTPPLKNPGENVTTIW